MNCIPIPEIAPTKFKKVANFGIANASKKIINVKTKRGK